MPTGFMIIPTSWCLGKLLFKTYLYARITAEQHDFRSATPMRSYPFTGA